MKTLRTWKIAYTIYDGEHKYGDYFTRDLATDRLNETTVAELIADQWDITDPQERKDFLREFRKEGHTFLPSDTRAISDLGWEAVSPIVVTVSGGVVQAVTGVPDGVTVEVQDWDGDERDEAGEAVPEIAVWKGSC